VSSPSCPITSASIPAFSKTPRFEVDKKSFKDYRQKVGPEKFDAFFRNMIGWMPASTFHTRRSLPSVISKGEMRWQFKGPPMSFARNKA
jgi:hypothetical protein